MRNESTSGYEYAGLNYHVAWTIIDSGGLTDGCRLTSRDQAWDFSQDMQMSRHAYNVTREHIPAQ